MLIDTITITIIWIRIKVIRIWNMIINKDISINRNRNKETPIDKIEI